MQGEGGLVTACSTIVPVEGNVAVGQGADEPAEADGHVVAEVSVGFTVGLDGLLVLMTLGHGSGEGIAWFCLGLEVCCGEFEQVWDGGAQGAAAGDGREVPVWGGFAAFSGGNVAGDETLLLVRTELDGGVGHAQGLGDVLLDELEVGRLGDGFEDVAEEADGEVGVFELADAFAAFVAVEEFVEVGGAVVEVGVGGIFEDGPDEVSGEPGQAGVVGAEASQGDGFGEVGQVEEIRDCIVEVDCAVLAQFREEDGGEDFGDGANFVNGIIAGQVGLAEVVGFGLAVLADADGEAEVGAIGGGCFGYVTDECCFGAHRINGSRQLVPRT